MAGTGPCLGTGIGWFQRTGNTDFAITLAMTEVREQEDGLCRRPPSPLGAEPEAELAPEPAALPPEKANILIVDDNPGRALGLVAVLDELNQNIVQASSGREALRCMLDQDFAVVLLDVQMPGMDGFETAALIRQRDKSQHTPIIFITAWDSSVTHVSRGYSLGAVDYIHAPLVPEVLRTKVQVFVELFRKTEQLRRQTEQLRRQTEQLRRQTEQLRRQTEQLRESARTEYERKLAEEKQLWELERLRREREEEKRISEALAEKNDELARSNAELDQFAHLAAHDLREPLRTIASYTQHLAKRYPEQLGPSAEDFIARILSNAQLMDRLISDLYTYSQVGREGRQAAVDCGIVFLSACGNLRAMLEESEAVVTCDSLPTVMGVET